MEDSRGISMSYQEVADTLPHRPPLLLVDKVVDLRTGESIHAIKCISALDPYFAGHFPAQPMFPGVYIVEGLAQASGILCFKTLEAQGETPVKECVLTSIESAKFRRPVVPGDVLHYHARIERSRKPFVWISGEAKVDGELVAEVKLSAMIGSPVNRKAPTR